MEFYRSYYFSYFWHLQDVIIVDTKKMYDSNDSAKAYVYPIETNAGYVYFNFFSQKKIYWYVLRLIFCSTNTCLYVGIFPAG